MSGCQSDDVPLADGGSFVLPLSQFSSPELKGYPASGLRLILISREIRFYVIIKFICVLMDTV